VKDAELAREQALVYGAKDLSNGVVDMDISNEAKTVKARNSLVYSPNGEVIEFLEKGRLRLILILETRESD